jgi:hypothetical protein
MLEAGMERSASGQDRSLAAEQRRRIAQLGKKTMELEIGKALAGLGVGMA